MAELERSDPELSRRFIARRLFKAIDLDMPHEQKADFLVAARNAVERAGFNPEYYFIEDRASDVLTTTTTPQKRRNPRRTSTSRVDMHRRAFERSVKSATWRAGYNTRTSFIAFVSLRK